MTWIINRIACLCMMLFACCLPIVAQTTDQHPANVSLPHLLPYQGYLTNSDNAPVDGQVTVTFGLYTVPADGSPLWNETQTVTASKGLISAMLGRSNPLSLPFDAQYYLGIRIGTDAELPQRVALGAGAYAFRALYADEAQNAENAQQAATAHTAGSLASGATGAVTSINTLQQDVKLEAGANVTITPIGNTLEISAAGDGTGIESVQNTNNTLEILDPNGPTATINVKREGITAVELANNAVTTAKLADGAVTTAKLAAGVIPASLPPTGSAGGDLSGNYPDPSIGALKVTTGKLADGAVTSAKIADQTIGTDDLADNSVTKTKILNGTVTLVKLNTVGANAGEVPRFDGTGVAWSAPVCSLEQAYNAGGAGVGRSITANAGAVVVAGADGFISTGSLGSGSLPASGPGVRMMWYPKKAAVRVGQVTGTDWNDSNIGGTSAAFGYNTIASGGVSFAIGQETVASNDHSVAMGSRSTASGEQAVAMGNTATASGNCSLAAGSGTSATGNYSVAMGNNTVAGGHYSTALGKGIRIIGSGSFGIGDNSRSSQLSFGTSDRFLAVFANGYRLYTNSAVTSGVLLNNNDNSWSAISDSTKKENILIADPERILREFRHLRLGSWNYKSLDAKRIRHYGPMAQEWFAAFGHDGIGTIGNDTLLASADVDGVLCIAIQALERRTTELNAKITETASLKDRLDSLQNVLARQQESIAALASRLNSLVVRDGSVDIERYDSALPGTHHRWRATLMLVNGK